MTRELAPKQIRRAVKEGARAKTGVFLQKSIPAAHPVEITKGRRARMRPSKPGLRMAAPGSPLALSKARRVFGGRKIVARLTGLSERTLATLEGCPRSISPSNRRRLGELDRLRKALTEIMQPKFIRTWMDTPNERLSRRTPLEIVEHGEIDRLWILIERVRSGEPT